MISRIKQGIKRLAFRNASRANYKFVLKDWMPLFELKYASEVLETKRFSYMLDPVEMECPQAQRIMVIAPHPDDELFGCGGVLLKAISKGAEVTVVYLTDGPRGDRGEVVKREAQNMCKAWGVDTVFLGHFPRAIPERDDHFAELIRSVKPQVVFTPFMLDDHDDHRRASQLLWTSFRDDSEFATEIWAYQIYSTVLPNVVVNVTDRMEEKLTWVRRYKSVSGNRDWANYVQGMGAVNSRYIPSSEAVWAEAFFVVPSKEYFDLCAIYFGNPANKIYRNQFYHC